jgi:hypothetical protein
MFDTHPHYHIVLNPSTINLFLTIVLLLGTFIEVLILRKVIRLCSQIDTFWRDVYATDSDGTDKSTHASWAESFDSFTPRNITMPLSPTTLPPTTRLSGSPAEVPISETFTCCCDEEWYDVESSSPSSEASVNTDETHPECSSNTSWDCVPVAELHIYEPKNVSISEDDSIEQRLARMKQLTDALAFEKDMLMKSLVDGINSIEVPLDLQRNIQSRIFYGPKDQPTLPSLSADFRLSGPSLCGDSNDKGCPPLVSRSTPRESAEGASEPICPKCEPLAFLAGSSISKHYEHHHRKLESEARENFGRLARIIRRKDETGKASTDHDVDADAKNSARGDDTDGSDEDVQYQQWKWLDRFRGSTGGN